MDMKATPLALLNNAGLLKTDALINGQWVDGSSRFAVHDPATVKYYTTSGLEEGLLNPDEFRAFMESDIAMWGEIVQKAKLPLDEVLARVHAAGIPIVNCVNRLRSPDDYVCFVGSDDYALGATVEVRVKKRTKKGGQSGELAIHFDSLDALSGILDKLRREG